MKSVPLLLVFSFVMAAFAQGNLVTVAIVGTNDIHGVAFPTQLFRSDMKQEYTYGGLEYLASMIEVVRKQHKGSFLYLDAGDQFQGGIQSGPLISSGEIINDYLNEAGADASAIGNHEFDFGPSFLFNYLRNRRDGSWNLAANLVSQNQEQQFLPKHKNMWLYELQSGIKIGVIGLSTVETPTTTEAFSKNTFPAYKFKTYADIVTRKSAELKAKGANAVILVTHLGNYCDADNQFGFWRQSTPQTSTCKKDDEISTLLQQIPLGTIDGVVQGHRHRFSHHFIRGVPVMGTIDGGYYFNILYLHFYNKVVYEKVIQGPVPVCQKVFANLKTCNYLTKKELERAGELVEWQFHRVKVEKHPEVKRLFQAKWLPKMREYLQPLTMNQLTLLRIYDQENPMGNLITNLVSAACPGHKFVILNAGAFRSVWYPGVIQQQHFYSMFPFQSLLISFEMTGYQLLETLKTIQSGKKAFYQTKNLRQHVRISSDGTKQLINATFMDGSQIELGKTYRGLSSSFLLNGGDDFRNVIDKIYILRKEIIMGDFNDLVKRQLKKIKTITQDKLLDPGNPRLIIERL